jgi:hypothetical protein
MFEMVMFEENVKTVLRGGRFFLGGLIHNYQPILYSIRVFPAPNQFLCSAIILP